MELYKNIKTRREQLGLSQDELAHLLGYASKSSIAKIEKGVNDIPQSKIQAFATALQTTPAYLMGWDNAISDRMAAQIPLEQIAFELDVPVSYLENLETQRNDPDARAKYDMVVRLLSALPRTGTITIEVGMFECFLVEQSKKLNAAGLQKTLEYINDLLEVGTYRK